MNSSFIFQNKDLIWPLMILAICLILLVVRELYRTNPRYKLLRIIATILMLGSLLAIWLEPQNTSKSKENTNLLLTSNYNQGQYDSLTKTMNFANVVNYDSMSYSEKVEQFSNTKTIIIGDGIPKSDIILWQEFDLQYMQPTSEPKGVIRVKFNKKANVGDKWSIVGQVNSGAKGSLKLIGFNTTLDSLEIDQGSQDFRLNTQLKTAGKYLFSIQHTDSTGKIITNHNIPLAVKVKETHKILIINSFPTFEMKYLKSHLIEKGHNVVVRNQLTRGRFKYEFYNTDRINLSSINSKILDQFALLITDHNTLQNFNKNTISSINNSIENKGLGVLVLPDETMLKRKHPTVDFKLVNSKETTTSFSYSNGSYQVENYGFTFDQQFGEQIMLKNSIISKRKGLGKVGVTTLKNTYQLILEGNHAVYQFIWDKQIENLITVPKSIDLRATWPINLNERMSIELNGLEKAEGIFIEKQNVAMIQDQHIATIWGGNYWPKRVGWHQMISNNFVDTLSFYVNRSDEWKSLRNYENRKANEKILKGKNRKGSLNETNKPIALIWFYLLFLISVGYLWLEPKL